MLPQHHVSLTRLYTMIENYILKVDTCIILEIYGFIEVKVKILKNEIFIILKDLNVVEHIRILN